MRKLSLANILAYMTAMIFGKRWHQAPKRKRRKAAHTKREYTPRNKWLCYQVTQFQFTAFCLAAVLFSRNADDNGVQK